MKARLRHLGVIAATACAGMMLWATPVPAHVTVNPSEAPKGGYAKLTFRVPNEKEMPTNKVEIVFDDKAVIAVARTKPTPGWTAEVKTRTLDKPVEVHGEEHTQAVESVTWTASDASLAIKPGEFQEFDVSVGPLPHSDEVVFKALQYYEGEAEPVRWIDTGDDAEHPAPVLELTKADDDHHGDSEGADDAHEDGEEAADSAKKFGIAGLVVGVVGLVVAAVALVRSSKARN